MNENEAMMIVAMLETNWQPFKATKPAIDLWASAFESDPYELVRTAVMALIQTDPSDFRPTVAKVRRKMHDMVYGRRMTETEAWLSVKNSLPEAQESPETLKGAKTAWAKLPEDVQKLVTPRQLLDWNSIEAEQMDTVIQSNFMRSYRELRDNRYEKEAMSSALLNRISAIQKASPVFKDRDAEAPKQAFLPEPEVTKTISEVVDEANEKAAMHGMTMTAELQEKHKQNLDAFFSPMTAEEKKIIEKRETAKAERYLK